MEFEAVIASIEQVLSGNTSVLAAIEDDYSVTTPHLEPTNGC